MLNALIQNGNQTAVLELPSDPFTLQYELAQIGVRSRLRDIPIKDDEESPIRVKLFADSDIGNSLAVLFKPSHSLEDANLCAHMVENASPELLEELEQHIVHGQYHSPQAVMADIKAMTEELIGVTVSYLASEEYKQYLPNVLVSTMQGSLDSFEDRMATLLFKIAVELCMVLHVTAATNQIDEDTLSRLRGLCVNEVKRLRGSVRLDDAVRFQNGE